jgi:hypothetical protein
MSYYEERGRREYPLLSTAMRIQKGNPPKELNSDWLYVDVQNSKALPSFPPPLTLPVCNPGNQQSA